MPPRQPSNARGRRRPQPARGAALALVLAALCVACGEGAREPRSRVLMIGIDGASPRVVRPLLAQGRLPNLSQIAAQGFYAPLHAFMPLWSPVVWTTIATGKRARQHGIVGFTIRAADGRQALMLGSDRKVHALWNIASDAGLRVAVVNWWNTYPPEKIHGIVVSDHAIPGEVERRRSLTGAGGVPGGSVVYPESWNEPLAELVSGEASEASPAGVFPPAAALPGFADADALEAALRADATVARIALAVEAEFDPDLMMVLLPGIDRVSHRLWGTIEPADAYPERLRPTPEARAAGRAALFAYYAYTDTLIGRLVERFAADDLVMVLSDHGFEAGVTGDLDLTGAHESDAARLGVLFARGRGIRTGPSERRVTIVDIAPTVLAWLGLPVARDMPGRLPEVLEVMLREPIDTYDTTPIERVETGPSPAEDEILENLRALGYIE